MRAPDTSSARNSVAEAVKTGSLSAVFNAYVHETVTNIPELSGHFAVLNIPESRVHMDITPHAAGFQSRAEVRDYMDNLFHSYAHYGSSFAHFDGKHNLAVVVYNGPDHLSLFADSVADNLKNIVGIADHEVGHLLIEGGYYYTNKHSETEILYAEAGADVFAGLRHLARFDGTSDDIRQLSWQRTKYMIEHQATCHFTSPSLNYLADLADTHDLSKLSMRQAVDLAARIASETAPHAAMVKNASRFLPKISEASAKEQGYAAALKPLADRVLKGNMDYMAGKVADNYLSPFLMEEVIFKGKPVLLDGPYWDKVRIALYHQRESHEKMGVLQGMPAKQKPPRF